MSAQLHKHAGRRVTLRSWPMLLGLAGCIGCSTGPHVVRLTRSEENLKHIAMAFTDAYEQNGDRAPKNVEELTPFLKPFGNPEEMLVSPNDRLPYVIVWGARPTGGPTDYKGMFPILAYEAKGAGSQRAVTDIRGRPMTVPNEDFAKLTFIGRHKPSDN